MHTEQCKSAAASRANNRMTGKKFKPFNCLSAASIVQRKRRPTTHYSAIRNSQRNKKQQQQYRLRFSQQWLQRNCNQESDQFTTTEIRAALRTSRSNTSRGQVNYPNQVIKISVLEGEVTDMLNSHTKALNIENMIPDNLMNSVIALIRNKGNSTALDNQRGFA